MQQEEKKIEKKVDLSSTAYNFLFGELTRLKEAGAIDDAGMALARDIYQVKKSRTSETVVATLFALGAASLIAFVYYTFHDFWNELFLRYKQYFLAGPFFISTICYIAAYLRGSRLGSRAGANIALFCVAATFIPSMLNASSYLADLFDVGRDTPDVMLLICATTTAFIAFLGKSRWIHGIEMVLICTYYISSSPRNYDDVLPEVGLAILLPLLVMGIFWSFAQKDRGIGTLYAILLGTWGLIFINRVTGGAPRFSLWFVWLTAVMIMMQILRKFGYDLVTGRNLAIITVFFCSLGMQQSLAVNFKTNYDTSNDLPGSYFLLLAVWILLIVLEAAVWVALDVRQRRKANDPSILEGRFYDVNAKKIAAIGFAPEMLGILVFPAAFIREQNISQGFQFAYYYLGAVIACAALRMVVCSKEHKTDFGLGSLMFVLSLFPTCTMIFSSKLMSAFLHLNLAIITFVAFALAFFLKKAAKRKAQKAENVESETNAIPNDDEAAVIQTLEYQPFKILSAQAANIAIQIVVAIEFGLAFWALCVFKGDGN